MKSGLRIATSIALSCMCGDVCADDLLDIYRQAVKSDPVYAQAEATWQAQQMNLPIARSGYLPQLGLTGLAQRDYLKYAPNYTQYPYTSWQYGYSLALSQQLYNYSAWQKIKGADATVKSATATYLASQQSLMQRSAQAYFNVLQAYDRLRYTIANKKAVWEQFAMSREQFRVGLIAITDEYDARARYDQVVAQQIAAQNNLNIQLENLRAITGRDYKSLASLSNRLPLISPQPNNMERWVTVANGQNYSIQAQNYSVIAAMDNIKQQAGGGYPSVALQASGNNLGSSYSGFFASEAAGDIGVQVTYNPIQGGLVNASTKQARYNYVAASDALEQTHRQVVNQTRSSFLSVLSYMSQVKADESSIVSARKALVATEAGLKVGTRTMVDVLDAITTLYESQQQSANDQYAYVNNLIALKEAAGTLSEKDLVDINRWLGKQVVFPDKTSVATVPEDISKDPIKTQDIDHIQGPMPPDAKAAKEEPPVVQPLPAAPQFTPLTPISSQPVSPPQPVPAAQSPVIPVPVAMKAEAVLPQPAQT